MDHRECLGSGNMFDHIAHRYDLLNRLMSMGMDQRWRRIAIDALELQAGSRLLDLATGTADVAIQAVKCVEGLEVVGLDPSRQMIELGREKVYRRGLTHCVKLEQGDGQIMPYPGASFDAAIVAFGIRNIPDRSAALRELRRVIRPRGRLAILEFSEPAGGVVAGMARFYIDQVIPRIGHLLSGSQEYRYLRESIAAFPGPGLFAEMMRTCGFSDIDQRTLSFGAVNLFVGQREEQD